VADRLNIPTDDVVMTTTSCEDPVPNYGDGLVTYITADNGMASDTKAIRFLWVNLFVSDSFS
jgi:hypothetical protein